MATITTKVSGAPETLYGCREIDSGEDVGSGPFGWIYLRRNPHDGDSVILDGRAYVAVSHPPGGGEFRIGENPKESASNLAIVIDGDLTEPACARHQDGSAFVDLGGEILGRIVPHADGACVRTLENPPLR